MDIFDIVRFLGNQAAEALVPSFFGAFFGCIVVLGFKPPQARATFGWQIGTSILAALLASVLTVLVTVIVSFFVSGIKTVPIEIPIIVGALIGAAYTNTRLQRKAPPASPSQDG